LPLLFGLWHCRGMSDVDQVAELCAFVAQLPAPKRPPIVVFDEHCATAEQIYCHLDPAAVPELAPVLKWLMEHRPELIAAVGDVDRTLVWAAMARTPLENLAVAHSLQASEKALREALRQAVTSKP
jgi:hypothetical protein